MSNGQYADYIGTALPNMGIRVGDFGPYLNYSTPVPLREFHFNGSSLNKYEEGLLFVWEENGLTHYQRLRSMSDADASLVPLRGYPGLRLLKVESIPLGQIASMAALERKQADERKEDESEYERLRKKLGK